MPSRESAEYLELYNAGFFAASTLQNELFDQLRQAGVVDLVTQKTGRRFFKPATPLTKEQLEEQLVFREKRSVEEMREIIDRSNWRIEVPRPEMSTRGGWSDVLKILTTRTHREYRGGRMETMQIDSVTFSYSPAQRLYIQGQKRTFGSQLVIPSNPSQIVRLKEAVEKAFDRPKIEKVTPRRRFIFGQVIRLGATA